MRLSSKFFESIMDLSHKESRYAIPAILPRKSGEKGGRESFVMFNHLRFIVYTVLVDPAPQNVTNSTGRLEKAEKRAVSRIEVTPMR